ncbi:MAG: 50S ribosomal protein L29 [Prolixibacteraceae bacterium]|jgi:large subunit ribosomal protein L29|nr:50S ribosomal protein L29 [Prolixibacteraceae bacterium]
MKNSEIIELTTKEIAERIDAEKDKLNRMRLNHAVSPLDNPMDLKEVKKDIARLKTEMRKRQLTENK